jgi:hypothetical protein
VQLHVILPDALNEPNEILSVLRASQMVILLFLRTISFTVYTTSPLLLIDGHCGCSGTSAVVTAFELGIPHKMFSPLHPHQKLHATFKKIL